MEERREMNGQRMMTREELEMRLPALNHIAEQDWLKISHEIPQELRDVTDRFIRAVRVHACNQVDTAYLAGMRDMMKIAAAFGLYEIDPDDVLPTRQRK